MRHLRGWPAGLALCAALLTACSTTVVGAAQPDPVVAAGLAAAAASTPTASMTPTAGPTTTPSPTPASPTSGSAAPGGGAVGPTHTATTTRTPPPATAAPSSTRSPTPVPAQVDTDELFDALTAALGRHDRGAFLRRFDRVAATAAAHWWDNLDAIGFDGGAVGSYRNDGEPVALDPDGSGTLPVVLAGVHAESDLVGADGARFVPSTAYRWGVRYDAGRLTVSSWTSLQQAPWDCGCRLHIARRGGAVVGAYPAEGALADDVVAGLAKALDWTKTFGDSVDAGWPALTGALAFVTAKPSRMAGWFHTRSSVDPDRDAYWAHPPPAFTYYLRGYDGQAGGIHHDGDYAGARILLGPDALADTTEFLVHELVHYRLSSRVNAGFLTTHAWVEEGVAQMIQQIYVGTTPEAAAAGQWVVGTKELGVGITADRLDEDFHDRPPTTAQLYAGDWNGRLFWYQVAASVYDYLAVRYGLRVSIDVATAAHAGRSPFALVPDPDRPSHMLPAAKVQHAWADWVRQTYG